jgi:hypothetical protein
VAEFKPAYVKGVRVLCCSFGLRCLQVPNIIYQTLIRIYLKGTLLSNGRSDSPGRTGAGGYARNQRANECQVYKEILFKKAPTDLSRNK